MLVSIDQAVEKLNSGEVVAIPTETVYGLAAIIDNNVAVNKIFTTKARPFFDPLIVHVSNVEQAQKLVKHWSTAALYIANEFWPGPLTLVIEKSDKVSDVISSGLSTVGLRMPRHKMALDLIKKVGPLAAPSANRFGRTSPTMASHVEDEYQSSVYVIDGGVCEVGIESTILHIKNYSEPYELSILRLGQISKEQIEAVLNRHQIRYLFNDKVEKNMAPGQMKHHYMPQFPLIICDANKKNSEGLLEQIQTLIQLAPSEVEGVKITKPTKAISHLQEMTLPQDPVLAARSLYSTLRNLALQSPECVVFYIQNYHLKSDWSAIIDRLSKAATVQIL